ncbi:MAG TPA: ATP-binding protein, partial [Thermoanaerobaculia bacterium]|nr:ATP-binding protein [Thermoanaerobaculia bacterium]
AAELGATHAELEDWGRTLEQRVDAKSAELAQAHQQMIQVEKMASLGKLAAIVAHELNNPLAGVATYAKLLQRRVAEVQAAPAADGESDFPRILHLIETEALRCGNIVKNLLLFSRTPTAVMADAELGPIVERVAMLVQHQADLREIELVRDLPAGLPLLTCDAAQIQQMLLALVMNALEATPQGGRVAIAARTRDRRMHLTVSDTGRGIPPEALPQIFEPFFTTQEAGAGVGLGLAVVYGIVERHGGHVSVASEPGGGTTFTVDLPLDRPAEAAGGEASG